MFRAMSLLTMFLLVLLSLPSVALAQGRRETQKTKVTKAKRKGFDAAKFDKTCAKFLKALRAGKTKEARSHRAKLLTMMSLEATRAPAQNKKVLGTIGAKSTDGETNLMDTLSKKSGALDQAFSQSAGVTTATKTQDPAVSQPVPVKDSEANKPMKQILKDFKGIKVRKKNAAKFESTLLDFEKSRAKAKKHKAREDRR